MVCIFVFCLLYTIGRKKSTRKRKEVDRFGDFLYDPQSSSSDEERDQPTKRQRLFAGAARDDLDDEIDTLEADTPKLRRRSGKAEAPRNKDVPGLSKDWS